MAKLDYENNEISLPVLIDIVKTAIENDAVHDFNDYVNLDDALQRNIYLAGDIAENTGIYVASLVRFWNRWDNEHNIPVEERAPIKIFINTNGGDLFAAFTMIDAISMSKTPVWTINEGRAFSGGFFTFIAGHKRFAYPHSAFLYHEGGTGTEGTASQFENYAIFYKKQIKQLEEITLKYTKITKEQYKEIHKDDYWMTAAEALNDGVCDEILEENIV